MTSAKYLVHRAMLLAGTLAAFAFCLEGAKRW
jgi:hypothetical protein